LHSSIVRAAAALAIASMAVVGLGGCFLLPLAPHRPTATATPSPRGEDAAAAPQTGDCWTGTHRHYADWASWEGEAAVPCTERHQSYTYAAADLDEAVEEPYDSVGVTGELLDAASNQCEAAFDEQFDVDMSTSRIGLYFFVPTEDEWDDGDHTIRCDVAALDLGSDYLDPDLADLPEEIDSFMGDAAHHELAYRLCVAGDGYGPYESTETEILDCTEGDYYWRLGGQVEFPADDSTPYPLDATLFDFALDNCPALGIKPGETVLPYTPTKEYWAYGSREIECWFSLIEGPPSTV
jgi:hypothetical protein